MADTVKKSILIIGNAPGAIVSDASVFDMVLGFNSLRDFDSLKSIITHHMMRMAISGGQKYGGEHLALQHAGQLVFADRVESRHVQDLERSWKAAGKSPANFKVRWVGLPYSPGKTPSTGYSVILWYEKNGYDVTVERFTFQGVKVHDWAFEEKTIRELATSGRIKFIESAADAVAAPQAARARQPEAVVKPQVVEKARKAAVVGLDGALPELAVALCAAGFDTSIALLSAAQVPSRLLAAASTGKLRAVDTVAEAVMDAEIVFVGGAADKAVERAAEIGRFAQHSVSLVAVGARRAGTAAEMSVALRKELVARFGDKVVSGGVAVDPLLPGEAVAGRARVVIGEMADQGARAASLARSVSQQLSQSAEIVVVGAREAEAFGLVKLARAEMVDWLDRRALDAIGKSGKCDSVQLAKALGISEPRQQVAEMLGVGPTAAIAELFNHA